MPDVVAEQHGAVLLLRLNRPEKGNAIGGTMFRDLLQGVQQARDNDDIHVVVTTGEGSTYCVGADLSHLEQARDYEPYQLLTGELEMADGTILGGATGLPPLSPGGRVTDWRGAGSRCTEEFWALEKPTIAALNGSAGGGGLAIALLHDFRVAAAGAKLATSFLQLGVGPELGMSYLLPRLVGWQVAAELLLRGRTLEAKEAAEIGLVNRVVPADRVLDEAMELAEELAALPSIAQQLTKRELRRSATSTFAEQLETEYRTQLSLFALQDHKAALRATRRRVGGAS
jgi:enoyl-CoA hydratase/carnithine racemase